MTEATLSMTTLQVYAALDGIQEGDRIFVEYLPAKEPSEEQNVLAEPALRLGIPRHQYTGRYGGLHFNEASEPYITVTHIPERAVPEGETANCRNLSLAHGSFMAVQRLTKTST